MGREHPSFCDLQYDLTNQILISLNKKSDNFIKMRRLVGIAGSLVPLGHEVMSVQEVLDAAGREPVEC